LLFVGDDDFAIEPESWERLTATERVTEVLDLVDAHLEGCEWTVDGVSFLDPLKAAGFKVRKVMPAIYAAVEGRVAGLPLFDSLVLLGRERSRSRVAAARARVP